MKQYKSDLHVKVGNTGWGWRTRKQNLFTLKKKKKKRIFLYYSECIGSPRMLKLGEAENF